jgi:hypothetical protein
LPCIVSHDTKAKFVRSIGSARFGGNTTRPTRQTLSGQATSRESDYKQVEPGSLSPTAVGLVSNPKDRHKERGERGKGERGQSVNLINSHESGSGGSYFEFRGATYAYEFIVATKPACKNL